jgi:AcrR family transcriptional regulator
MSEKNPKAPVRKRRKETSPRDAEASRARILDAAKIRFSQNSYEGVGVREIAADAGVDASLVMRYFGSKEALFREIATVAFDTDDVLGSDAATLPERAAETLMWKLGGENWRTGYDPLRLLLGSIGSPTAGPILAQHLDQDFVKPIAAALSGEAAQERGAMIAAEILGFALIRLALGHRETDALDDDALRQVLLDSLSRVVSGPR